MRHNFPGPKVADNRLCAVRCMYTYLHTHPPTHTDEIMTAVIKKISYLLIRDPEPKRRVRLLGVLNDLFTVSFTYPLYAPVTPDTCASVTYLILTLNIRTCRT